MASDTATPLRPGFADPTLNAQQVFRRLLEAMAQPGTLSELDCPLEPPRPLAPATAAAALTLFDGDTRVWLDGQARSPEVETFLRFHCGCPLVADPKAADFAICLAWPQDFGTFAWGEAAYPDRSATLIVQVERLEEGPGLRLSGPGIRETAEVAVSPCPADLAPRWAAMRAEFPLGLDLILTAGRRFCGLPRSLTIAEA